MRMLLLPLIPCALATAGAQIRVNPTGVNVNAQGATTVFLSYGGLAAYVPAEGTWCGALVPAAPDLGMRCDPSSLFGRLPARYDVSRVNGAAYTDIMSIPPSVARRAYEAAAAGENSAFFYVRRFVAGPGRPDQYVVVTCRMAGGGARVPLALTDVRIAFDVETPILFVYAGATPPPLTAEITYTGTGRLVGRWEVVQPGDELPGGRDLLPEASLPPNERGTQRRYTPLERFNIFLPPTGKVILRGPDPSRLPTLLEGAHQVVLRIEASDDKEGDSNLASAGAGVGIVHSGAVAGFPLPSLRYIVGSGGSELSPTASHAGMRTVLPREQDLLTPGQSIEFSWTAVPNARLYELEVRSQDDVSVLGAVLLAKTNRYRAPSWLAERAGNKPLRWRVVATNVGGDEIQRTPWRTLRIRQAAKGSPQVLPK